MNELTALPFLTLTEINHVLMPPIWGIFHIEHLRAFYSLQLKRTLTQEQTYQIVDYFNERGMKWD